MSGKRCSVEQIINHLREAEVSLAQGKPVGENCRQIGGSEQSYDRWPRQYNILKPHSALGYRSSSPETILPHAIDLPSAAQGLRADRRFKDGARSLN